MEMSCLGGVLNELFLIHHHSDPTTGLLSSGWAWRGRGPATQTWVVLEGEELQDDSGP